MTQESIPSAISEEFHYTYFDAPTPEGGDIRAKFRANRQATEDFIRSVLIPFNSRYAVLNVSGKTVIGNLAAWESPDSTNQHVRDSFIPKPLPEMQSLADFRNLHSNRKVTTWKAGKPRIMPVADIWLDWVGRRQYDEGIRFVPGVEQADMPPQVLNLFRGWGMTPDRSANAIQDEKACSELLHHLRVVVCGGDNHVYGWLMSWMADILHNPTSKPGTAVILAGRKGCGKSTISEILRKVIGARYCVKVAQKSDIVGDFSGHLATALLVACEEAMFGGDSAANDVLKDRITSETILINEKFMPRVEMRNHARFLFTTNSHYSHQVTDDERRYLCLDVGGQFCGDKAYWDKFHAQLANGGLQAFANTLWNWKQPPGVNLRSPPRTSAHARLYEETLNVEERYFFNALKTGDNWPEDAEEEAAEISLKEITESFTAYLDDNGKRGSLKKTSSSFIPDCIAKYWQGENVGRKMSGRHKVTIYRIPARAEAQDIATLPSNSGGLGLTREGVGLEDE